MKAELALSAYQLATDQELDPRNRNSALRSVLAMESQNIERHRIDHASESVARPDSSITVVYTDSWFHEPTEEQVRELEDHRGNGSPRSHE